VNLLTYHRSKGLEFDAVFLPRLDEKELPSKLAQTPEEIAEERRLLYVGITRARSFLAISWSKRPSQFLAELGVSRPVRSTPAAPHAELDTDDPLYKALATWRLARAKEDEVPAFIVFSNVVLAAIADARPRSRQELERVPGIGPVKLDRYGDAVLAVVGQAV
jgi:DNA helicase-2/ATP-dependent DNA helicase PcrA